MVTLLCPHIPPEVSICKSEPELKYKLLLMAIGCLILKVSELDKGGTTPPAQTVELFQNPAETVNHVVAFEI